MKTKADKSTEVPRLPLEKLRLQNFKAVRDSGLVSFTPLTVFIGNNGSGKSSLIEGLETFQNIALHGLDAAFLPWRGFEHVWNQAVPHDKREDQIGKLKRQNPMAFEIEGVFANSRFHGDCEIATDLKEGNQIVFAREEIADFSSPYPDDNPVSELQTTFWNAVVSSWQFLNLEPRLMLDPKPEARTGREIRLLKDGSNIAQYLQSIADKNPAVLQGIAETVKSVLPYAADLRPAITTELQRTVYLRLYEEGLGKEHVLPSWLLSQGTLRIVALLAVLRHPEPPSVVFIEELENGLDPRTIHLIIDEIRAYLDSGGQVVATTHSPYLLDLLDLSHLVIVERSKSGAPMFKRPSKQKLKGWSEKFAPGRLYTMGNLTES